VLLSAAMALASRKTQDGENDRPTPLLGAIITGAAVGFASGLPAVECFSRLCSSRYTGRLRDRQPPFQPLYIGKFDRRACRCLYVGRPRRPDLAVCSRGLGGGHDWNNDRTALVVTSNDPVRLPAILARQGSNLWSSEAGQWPECAHSKGTLPAMLLSSSESNCDSARRRSNFPNPRWVLGFCRHVAGAGPPGRRMQPDREARAKVKIRAY